MHDDLAEPRQLGFDRQKGMKSNRISGLLVSDWVLDWVLDWVSDGVSRRVTLGCLGRVRHPLSNEAS